MPRYLLILTTSVALVAASGCASSGPRQNLIPPQRTIAPQIVDAPAVLIDIPVGELRINNADDDRLRADLRLYCEHDDGVCAERASATELLLETGPERWRLTSSEKSRWYYRDMDVKAEVYVPAGLDLDVRFGFGALEIEHRGGCLNVDMAAGDVSVEMPIATVRRVRLDANAGDASLRADGRYVEGRRPWLIGAEVLWEAGQGPCDVEVDLGAGDISMSLK